jgi:hypothetical protein
MVRLDYEGKREQGESDSKYKLFFGGVGKYDGGKSGGYLYTILPYAGQNTSKPI